MKKLLFLFVVLFAINSFSQETNFKKYSYTEFFDKINSSKDSIVRLNNIFLEFDDVKDKKLEHFKSNSPVAKSYPSKDTLYIKKEVVLNNVFDLQNYSNYFIMLQNIVFEEKLTLNNSSLYSTANSVFLKDVSISYGDDFIEVAKKTPSISNRYFYLDALASIFFNCRFYGQVVYGNNITEDNGIYTLIKGCNFYDPESENRRGSSFIFRYENQGSFDFTNNTLHSGRVYMGFEKSNTMTLSNNDFSRVDQLNLNLSSFNAVRANISQNITNNNITLNTNSISNIGIITWPQFSESLIDVLQLSNFAEYLRANNYKLSNGFAADKDYESERNLKYYKEHFRIENEQAYHGEKKLRSLFYNYYKQNLNTEYSNHVYVEIKNLETKRFAYLYSQNPTFKTFFKWRINQFLKVFSGYGTEPERAVIFSLYVILFFALIYLFFPNSWDKHGKNRIIDRYSFFFKYMNKQAGIHEVYLEDQKAEIMQYDTFKNLIKNSNQSVPKFFSATALPLYKWAISGTKISASFLSKIDIMKGTWSELPKSKRIWKSILLVGAFLIAIIYDLFIKMLNALMLSINTFTTLGFGEIPIKGLPRYLAIIQGFIGWFMLTIFSVSLISQLLN